MAEYPYWAAGRLGSYFQRIATPVERAFVPMCGWAVTEPNDQVSTVWAQCVQLICLVPSQKHASGSYSQLLIVPAVPFVVPG